MSVAEATPDLEQLDESDRSFLGHPKGLGFLGFTLPTTTFWLIHAASAAVGLVAFVIFKVAIGKRIESTAKEQAAALS